MLDRYRFTTCDEARLEISRGSMDYITQNGASSSDRAVGGLGSSVRQAPESFGADPAAGIGTQWTSQAQPKNPRQSAIDGRCNNLTCRLSVDHYRPADASAEDLGQMRRIDELHLEFPFTGGRVLRDLLVHEER